MNFVSCVSSLFFFKCMPFMYVRTDKGIFSSASHRAAARPGRYHASRRELWYRPTPTIRGLRAQEKLVPSSSSACTCSATRAAKRSIIAAGHDEAAQRGVSATQRSSRGRWAFDAAELDDGGSSWRRGGRLRPLACTVARCAAEMAADSSYRCLSSIACNQRVRALVARHGTRQD